jgi:hypothetical protein
LLFCVLAEGTPEAVASVGETSGGENEIRLTSGRITSNIYNIYLFISANVVYNIRVLPRNPDSPGHPHPIQSIQELLWKS